MDKRVSDTVVLHLFQLLHWNENPVVFGALDYSSFDVNFFSDLCNNFEYFLVFVSSEGKTEGQAIIYCISISQHSEPPIKCKTMGWNQPIYHCHCCFDRNYYLCVYSSGFLCNVWYLYVMVCIPQKTVHLPALCHYFLTACMGIKKVSSRQVLLMKCTKLNDHLRG